MACVDWSGGAGPLTPLPLECSLGGDRIDLGQAVGVLSVTKHEGTKERIS